MKYLFHTARLLAWVWIMTGAANSFAVAQPVQIRGYAKNLGIVSKSVVNADRYWLDLTRVRLEAHAEKSDFIATVTLDTELAVGSFFDIPEFEQMEDPPRTAYLDFLQWNVAEADRLSLDQKVYRAYLHYYGSRVQVKAGRQRIAWGSGFFWNPSDLINPFNPGALEREEKQGIDAVSASFDLSALSRVEAVVAPGWSGTPASFAARGTFHVGEYDISGMVGSVRGQHVAGADFAGYLGGAGFRGEAAVVAPAEGDSYFRAILNGDYTFSSGTYLIGEYYYNGLGSRDPESYDFSLLVSGSTFNLARNYLAFLVSQPVSPLVGSGVYSLVNLDDQSILAGPALTWSPAQSLDVQVGAYFFIGSDESEYGRQNHVYLASIQGYF